MNEKKTSRLVVKTALKAGGLWNNHSRVPKVRTAIKSGGIWMNHSRALKVETAIKSGGFWNNHCRALKVKSAIKSGGIWANHSRAFAVRSAVQGRRPLGQSQPRPHGKVRRQGRRSLGQPQPRSRGEVRRQGRRSLGQPQPRRHGDALAPFARSGRPRRSRLKWTSAHSRSTCDLEWALIAVALFRHSTAQRGCLLIGRCLALRNIARSGSERPVVLGCLVGRRVAGARPLSSSDEPRASR